MASISMLAGKGSNQTRIFKRANLIFTFLFLHEGQRQLFSAGVRVTVKLGLPSGDTEDFSFTCADAPSGEGQSITVGEVCREYTAAHPSGEIEIVPLSKAPSDSVDRTEPLAVIKRTLTASSFFDKKLRMFPQADGDELTVERNRSQWNYVQHASVPGYSRNTGADWETFRSQVEATAGHAFTSRLRAIPLAEDSFLMALFETLETFVQKLHEESHDRALPLALLDVLVCTFHCGRVSDFQGHAWQRGRTALARRGHVASGQSAEKLARVRSVYYPKPDLDETTL